MLNDTKSNRVKYVRNILLDEELKKAGLTKEAVEIINESPKDYNAKYASAVLTDSSCIKAGIAINGAKYMVYYQGSEDLSKDEVIKKVEKLYGKCTSAEDKKSSRIRRN